MKYELWKESDSYSFFPDDNLRRRSLLGAEAVLLWTVEADNWEEAQSRKHDFLGWEPCSQ
jgi:hypothetical protein